MKADEKKVVPKLIVAVLIIAAVSALLWKHFSGGTFTYAGTVEATRVDLPARVPTVVKAVLVQEGAKVKKGQKVAELACEEIRIAADQLNESFKRALKLKSSGSVSDESFDQIDAKKKESDARLSWCDVTTPISGTVLTRYLEPGEWTNPGAKLLSLADLTDAWAYIYVPQEVMSHIKPGLEVQGRVVELGDKIFKGTIRKINEEAEFTPKNVQTRAERTRLVFGVKVAFENTDETLKPGMTVEVSLPDHPSDDAESITK